MAEVGDEAPRPSSFERDDLDLLTVAAAAVLAWSLSVAIHQLAHAAVGSAFGGRPGLVSVLEAGGDWSRLDESRTLIMRAAGSGANALLALVGWLGVRRGKGRAGVGTVFAWLLFVASAWMPTVHLILSPIVGFGDWMTAIDGFPNRGPLRASAFVTGLFIAGVLWKGTTESLATIVGGGPAALRTSRAERLVRVGWAAGGAVALAAVMSSPLGVVRALPVVVVSVLVATAPMLRASVRVEETPVRGAALTLPRSIPVILAGVAMGLALVLAFGPGVRLGAG